MLKEINIKTDMPPANIAIARIEEEIEVHKMIGDKAIKFIHGYGSSTLGGGKIRMQLHRLLPGWKKRGFIYDYIKGENFTTNTIREMRLPPAVREILIQDALFSPVNKGVTVIILQP